MIRIAGIELEPDPSGALLWAAEATLVVADLHFEKASHFAERGSPLPPYDTGATLSRLEQLVVRTGVQRVICLGDSFHDCDGPDRMPVSYLDRLLKLTAAADWIWVEGNHDPRLPAHIGGRIVRELELGPIVFRHKLARPRRAAEVSGHYHPKATVHTRGRSVTRPCFVSDGERIVLPAFGAYTGGLDVADAAFKGLFAGGFEVFLLGDSKLHRFPSDAISSAARPYPYR